MTERTQPSFAFSDFECSISTPWNRDEIELSFDDRHREAWRALTVSGVVTSEDDDFGDPPELDDEGNEIPVTPHLHMMDVALGTVSAERRFADGEVETFARYELEMHLEPGPWGEIREGRCGRATALWSTRFERLFVRVARALCDAEVPPPVKLPPAAPRPCTAAALAGSGWAAGGAEVSCPEVDDYWNPGTPIDVARLLAEIAGGATHRRPRGPRRDSPPDALIDDAWAVLRDDDGSLRLVTPLAIEILRVEVTGHERPGFLTARYFLAIDVDARGEVESVTVRAARDGTFDAETDDSPAMFAQRDPPDDSRHLRDRLTSLAYGPVSWVVEDHLREEALEDANEA